MFKVGDVVRLKSGGPRMTVVTLLDGEPSIAVGIAWHSEDLEMQGANLPVDALELAGPSGQLATVQSAIQKLGGKVFRGNKLGNDIRTGDPVYMQDDGTVTTEAHHIITGNNGPCHLVKSDGTVGTFTREEANEHVAKEIEKLTVEQTKNALQSKELIHTAEGAELMAAHRANDQILKQIKDQPSNLIPDFVDVVTDVSAWDGSGMVCDLGGLAWRGTMAEWLRDGPLVVAEAARKGLDIARVVISDKKPVFLGYAWGCCGPTDYGFFREGCGTHQEHTLPVQIFDTLDPGSPRNGAAISNWRSEEKLLSVFSYACLAWARQQAKACLTGHELADRAREHLEAVAGCVDQETLEKAMDASPPVIAITTDEKRLVKDAVDLNYTPGEHVKDTPEEIKFREFL